MVPVSLKWERRNRTTNKDRLDLGQRREGSGGCGTGASEGIPGTCGLPLGGLTPKSPMHSPHQGTGSFHCSADMKVKGLQPSRFQVDRKAKKTLYYISSKICHQGEKTTKPSLPLPVSAGGLVGPFPALPPGPEDRGGGCGRKRRKQPL